MVLALAAVVAATLPTVAGVLPLSMAVLVHEGSTLLVVLNSLRKGDFNDCSLDCRRFLLSPSLTLLGWPYRTSCKTSSQAFMIGTVRPQSSCLQMLSAPPSLGAQTGSLQAVVLGFDARQFEHMCQIKYGTNSISLDKLKFMSFGYVGKTRKANASQVQLRARGKGYLISKLARASPKGLFDETTRGRICQHVSRKE
eukprot:1160423-Pelagomonas_calceolata.AAC.13